MNLRPRSGQSLVELLVGMAVGGVFIVGVATIIAPSLQTNKAVSVVQAKAELANEMANNIQAWAAGNWDDVLALATGTANTYSLDASSSPFMVAGSSTTSGGGSGPATPTFVQGGANSTGGTAAPSISLTTVSDVTTGDFIIATGACFTTNCTNTISDSAGNTYTSITGGNFCFNGAGGGPICQTTYYAEITSGGGAPLTITNTVNASQVFVNLAYQEYSGISTSTPFDVSADTMGTANAVNPTTISTNAANELIYTAASPDSDLIAAGSCIERGQTSDDLTTEDEDVTSAGSYACIFTDDNGASGWVAQVAGFEAATGSGGGSTTSYSTSTESVSIGGITYTRYFYLSDVYRDAGGNATTTAAGNNYDPSTKLVTIVATASTTPAGTPFVTSFYLTRNQDNVFDQTSWAGGSGQTSPITVAKTDYAEETNVSVDATGSIQLSIGNGSCVL